MAMEKDVYHHSPLGYQEMSGLHRETRKMAKLCFFQKLKVVGSPPLMHRKLSLCHYVIMYCTWIQFTSNITGIFGEDFLRVLECSSQMEMCQFSTQRHPCGTGHNYEPVTHLGTVAPVVPGTAQPLLLSWHSGKE